MENDSDFYPSRLLKTPLPRADESFMGYMLRLTEENVYLSPSWIFELAGLKVDVSKGGWPVVYRNSLDSTGLEHVTGLERQEIDNLRYQISEAHDSLYARRSLIGINFVKFNFSKVCPVCLKQFGYCQYVWDLLPFTACPLHEVMLIDKCPGCQKHISWARQSISKCHCGVDWRECELIKVDHNELKLPKLISELSNSIRLKIPFPSHKKGAYSTLDLNDLIQVLSLMADYYLQLTKGQRLRATTENALCHTAYSLVAPIIEDWPKNYLNFLEWIKKHEGYQGLVSLHKIISKECGRTSLFFAISALEMFIEKVWDSLEDSSELYLPIKRQFINKREACLKLTIDEDWLDVLIVQRKVESFYGDGDEILIYLPSLELLLSELSGFMAYWSAAAFLGVQASDVMYLIRNNCLKAVSGPNIDGFGTWRVEPADVTRLIRKIEMKITDEVSLEDDRVIYGWEVLKYLKQYELSAGKFIVDMLNDEVVPVGEFKGEGITKFLFLKDQVIKYRQNLHPEELPVNVFNYREKFLEKLEWEKAHQKGRPGKGRTKAPDEFVRGIAVLLDNQWAQNDLVYTNKGIESFNIQELGDVAKLIFRNTVMRITSLS